MSLFKGKKMKTYLISGTQLDGEHEYSINCLFRGDKLTAKEAQRQLVMQHAFGGIDEGDEVDFEDFSTYGDGLTAIQYAEFVELTEVQLEVIKCLGLVY